jgi:radical SAM protein with 4Fe4S-binding SPASM domain
MSIGPDTRLGSPDRSHVFERAGEAVFFSRETYRCVRVNATGQTILQEIRPGDTPLDLAARLAPAFGLGQPAIMAGLLPFLESVVKGGYLSVGPLSTDQAQDLYDTSFRPIQMYLHVTHVCNQSCVYCYNSEYRHSLTEPELSFAELIAILREGAEVGVREVVFTGGEPLLRPEVLDLAAEGQRLGLKLSLLTNGAMIENIGAERLAELFDGIFVSLDSSRESEHDLLRGAGSFRRATAGVRRLCALAPDRVRLRPVVTRHNLESLIEYPAWAANELGCRIILSNMYLPNSFAELEDLRLLPDLDRLGDLTGVLRAASEQAGVTNIWDCQPFRSHGKCGAGSQIVSIDATGEVFPCQALHYAELSCGNVRRNSLAEIGRAKPMRRVADLSIQSIEGCRDCELGPVCGGGCRGKAYALYRDIHACDEFFCPLLKRDAEDRLWAESEKHRTTAVAGVAADRNMGC